MNELELEIKAILKVLANVKWDKENRWQRDCNQCEFAYTSETTNKNNSICGKCYEDLILQRQKILERLDKWKNKLKEKIKMFEVTIDREVLDEVETTVTDNEFAQYLLSHTTDFAAAAFILDACIKALDQAREKLDEQI